MVCAFGTREQFYPRPRGEVWSIPGWDVNGLDPRPRTMHPAGRPAAGGRPDVDLWNLCGFSVPGPPKLLRVATTPRCSGNGGKHQETRRLANFPARLLAYTKAPAATSRTFLHSGGPLSRMVSDKAGAAQAPCRFPVFRRDFRRPSGQGCTGRDEAVLRGGRIPVRHPYRKEASRPRTASSSPARDVHGWTCLTRWLSRSPRAGASPRACSGYRLRVGRPPRRARPRRQRPRRRIRKPPTGGTDSTSRCRRTGTPPRSPSTRGRRPRPREMARLRRRQDATIRHRAALGAGGGTTVPHPWSASG